MSRHALRFRLLRAIAATMALLLSTTLALAQDPALVLKPPDLSSPRATLKTFLDSTDAVAEFVGREYDTATLETARKFVSLVAIPLQTLDLDQVPPAARMKTGRAAAVALYEVLSRIQLPPWDQIPDAEQMAKRSGDSAKRWVIPDTAIAIVREESGPHAGQFRFSSETVAKAEAYYQRVRGLPYTRPVPFENLHDFSAEAGGWMIPYRWVRALPSWMRNPVVGQSGWKWIGLAVILCLYGIFLWLVYRLSKSGHGRHPLIQALAEFAMPLGLLAATPVAAGLALNQINVIGAVGSHIELYATAIMFIAGAWMVWRLAPVFAEAIIASPKIPTDGIDAHLIRVFARLLGVIGAATLLALGADRLGVPVYGIVAGLGVGGLAIALAAQPTVENLIGGLNLFADKPIRVGDVCKYGDQTGTVEAIGIRSARIRGVDRTLTTIPNAALAKMPIVNLTARDKLLISSIIRLRYETTQEQLRNVLSAVGKLLVGHPRIDADTAWARFIGFGTSSLDIELSAYVTTRNWDEFLGIREEVLLRVMDLIEEAGTAVAVPSQSLYIGRERLPADARAGDSASKRRAGPAEGTQR